MIIRIRRPTKYHLLLLGPLLFALPGSWSLGGGGGGSTPEARSPWSGRL